MPTPIERAAKAFHAKSKEMGGSASQWEWGDPQYARIQAIYIDLVKTVISAIREPNSTMTHAAQSESHVAGGCEVDYHGIWASMIDALLKEGT